MKYILYIFLTAIVVYSAFSFSSYVARIPNGSVKSCSNCHVGGDPSSGLTSFGTAFDGAGRAWNATLAAMDSDGDTYTNGTELQDPTGAWTQGSPAPGNAALVTNPGDPNDYPTSVNEIENYLKLMTVNPNPAVDNIFVNLDLVSPQMIQLDLYDNAGKKLAELFSGYVETLSFKHPFTLSSSIGYKLLSGTYFVKVTIDGVAQTAKFAVID